LETGKEVEAKDIRALLTPEQIAGLDAALAEKLPQSERSQNIKPCTSFKPAAQKIEVT
jgi:hypothetical protein